MCIVLYIAAVSCSPVTYRFGAGRICVLVDGQAGPCMVSVYGWCLAFWLGQVGRAWCMALVQDVVQGDVPDGGFG